MVPRSPRSNLAKNQLPTWVQGLNWLDRQLQQMGVSLITFSEDSLRENAQKKAQLSDWGNNSFRLGLQALLTSIHQEANLSLTGRWMMRRHLTNLLANRLQIQESFNQYPEILNVPIQRPLIITGLPRTGTTFLHRLLAQDPQFRWLRLWELLQPYPPPDQARASIDPRVLKAQTLARQYKTMLSSLSTAHLIDVQLPEEGNQLLEHSFTNFLFSLRGHMPTYETWLRAQDMTTPYQYYRQQLQLLSWQWPGRWLLKAPCHLRNLDALLSAFPDACIVQTHRDPCSVVPSMCSLTATSRGIFTHNLDLEITGRDILEMTAYDYHRGRQFRAQHPSVQICDVDYANLVQEPLKTVQHIYQFFEASLYPEAAHKMKHWLAANLKNKHGSHRYSLEQFGLSKATIQAKFT